MENNMTKDFFEKELEKKCFSTNGSSSYFKSNYIEARDKKILLVDIVDGLKTDICWDAQDNPEFNQKLLDMTTETLEQQMNFINLYFKNLNICSFPELCGHIVGSLVASENIQLAYDFLGLSKINQKINWD